jgi:hypothetical protein
MLYCEHLLSTALRLQPIKLLNFDFNGNPDPAFHSNADPDPAFKNNADPDAQLWPSHWDR